MRLHLTLHCRSGSRIPINYAYEFSAWIYKVLANADPAFATWLHEHGYTLEGNKRFKFFTFSQLQIQPPFRIEPERQAIRIESGKVSLVLSFLLDDTLEQFVTGLFRQQQFGIGNAQYYPTDFTVQAVEILPKPVFRETMRFRTLSPICVAASEEGIRHAQYRHPNDPDYLELLINNLLQKSQIATHSITVSTASKESTTRTSQLPNPEPPTKNVKPQNMNFKLLSDPRQKGITLKSHTQAQTKVIGYTYDFEITAPPELLEIAYYAGFGTENAQGFGCVEIIGKYTSTMSET